MFQPFSVVPTNQFLIFCVDQDTLVPGYGTVLCLFCSARVAALGLFGFTFVFGKGTFINSRFIKLKDTACILSCNLGTVSTPQCGHCPSFL